jgi:hypothetical protein
MRNRIDRRLKLRALFVAFHVVAMAIVSLPNAGIASKARWQSDVTQNDLATWAARLRAMGWRTSNEAFQRRLWDGAVRYARVRTVVGAPFDAYAGATGAGQGWTMFASPQRFPAELHVDVLRGGIWTPIYRPRSDAYAWRRETFDDDRMRKFAGRFARGFDKNVYRETATWIAKNAAIDFPDASRVRVSLYRYETLAPAAVRRGERPVGRTTDAREIELGPLR